MDLREKRFVHEYIINGGNAYQAALAAGYEKSTARKANQWLDPEICKNQKKRRPYKQYLVDAIAEEVKKIESDKIADEIEIMQYLTAVMRKESISEETFMEQVGRGISRPTTVERKPTEKESLEAAKSLARILGIEKKQISVEGEVNMRNPMEGMSTDELKDLISDA